MEAPGQAIEHRLPTKSFLEELGDSLIMSTVADPVVSSDVSKRRLVEMNWDPITRIVGSLGIYTKIILESPSGGVPQHLVNLSRLKQIDEGERRP